MLSSAFFHPQCYSHAHCGHILRTAIPVCEQCSPFSGELSSSKQQCLADTLVFALAFALVLGHIQLQTVPVHQSIRVSYVTQIPALADSHMKGQTAMDISAFVA